MNRFIRQEYFSPVCVQLKSIGYPLQDVATIALLFNSNIQVVYPETFRGLPLLSNRVNDGHTAVKIHKRRSATKSACNASFTNPSEGPVSARPLCIQSISYFLMQKITCSRKAVNI